MQEYLKAVYQKNIEYIKAMIEDGFDVNTVDEDGRTSLMHAILDSEPDHLTIKFLLAEGVNVNHQDTAQKWSALHFAARDNKASIVQVLIESGATIDLVDVFGNTPLWRATTSYAGDPKVINLLVAHGADPKIENKSGVSCIELARTLGKNELIDIFTSKI